MNDLVEVKSKAMTLEENFKFDEALRLYETCENVLTVDDGSLVRYAKLLYEYQNFEKAKKILEDVVLRHRHVTVDLLRLLAETYEHLGMEDKALAIYEKIGDKRKSTALKNERNLLTPKKAQILKFLELFSGREDTFSIQTENGYFPVRRPMNETDVAEHFAGKKTLGIYVLRTDDTVKFAAYDVDVKKNAEGNQEQLLYECREAASRLFKSLLAEGFTPYIEFSGNKGYHIWIFFESPVQAYRVKHVLEKISSGVKHSESVKVEIFPKQAQTNGGLGNLIKAPLGIHRKTGKRCVFLNEHFEVIEDQMAFLMEIQRNSADLVKRLYRELSTDEEVSLNEQRAKPGAIRNAKTPSSSCENKDIQQSISSARLKEELRREIKHLETSLQFTQSCSIIAQIIQKIEKVAYVDEFEEKVLVSTLRYLQDGSNVLEKLFRNTINYSTERLRNLLSQTGALPVTCEEIKKHVLAYKLPLDLSKCNCRFTQPLNTPANYISPQAYIEKLEPGELALTLIEKIREKAELENEITRLKTLIGSKLEGELRTESYTIRKNERGEIEIQMT